MIGPCGNCLIIILLNWFYQQRKAWECTIGQASRGSVHSLQKGGLFHLPELREGIRKDIPIECLKTKVQHPPLFIIRTKEGRLKDLGEELRESAYQRPYLE